MNRRRQLSRQVRQKSSKTLVLRSLEHCSIAQAVNFIRLSYFYRTQKISGLNNLSEILDINRYHHERIRSRTRKPIFK